MKADEFDWLGAYTTAMCFWGWSDSDFWAATPRKYFAVLYKYVEIKNSMNDKPKQEVLVGKQALNALSNLAMQIR